MLSFLAFLPKIIKIMKISKIESFLPKQISKIAVKINPATIKKQMEKRLLLNVCMGCIYL